MFSFISMKERDKKATQGHDELDDCSSAVGLLVESSPVGLLLESLPVGLLSESLPVGMLLKLSPVGMLVDLPIGELLELLPIGTLADSCVGMLLKSSPVGTLVNSLCAGSLLELSPVGALVESSGVGLLLESLGIGMISRLLGIGTLVKSHNGVLAKLCMGRHQAVPSPSHANQGHPEQDENNVITAGATDEPCPQATQFGGLLDQSQPEPSDDRLRILTLAEEEESTGEEETLSLLWHAGSSGHHVKVVSRGTGSGGDCDSST